MMMADASFWKGDGRMDGDLMAMERVRGEEVRDGANAVASRVATRATRMDGSFMVDV